jgi:hypothetical protein
MKEIEANDLRFAIGYALSRVRFTPTKKRRLEETDCSALTKAVLDHFKLCQWHVMHEPVPWHSVNYGPPVNDSGSDGQ